MTAAIVDTQSREPGISIATGGDFISKGDILDTSVLHINADRLWSDIHETARWGNIQGTEGMNRLALSEEDKAVRHWFVQEAERIGCKVNIDAMGNIFAILPGRDTSLPPIGIGSHLDTQPAGGKYDGILGVLGGLEILRTLKPYRAHLRHSIAVVVWTNEEGAAFFPGCSGSSVWAEWVALEDAHKQKHCQTGELLGDALERIGAKGTIDCSHNAQRLSAHFELHIEQGPHLERTNRSIGVVRNIQGIRRYKIICHGRQGHAGTVPMDDRADALVAASRIVLKLDDLARSFNAHTTVGILSVHSPSPNTIPSKVELTADARHLKEDCLDAIEKDITEYLAELSRTTQGLSFSTERKWHSPALNFDDTVANCIYAAAVAECGEDQVDSMTSFAGHDSALTAMKVPSAMIFVPSKNGVSHTPEEFTSKEDCRKGVQTMLRAVLLYDRNYLHAR